MSRLKIGVVGAGAWGRNHVRTVAGLAEGELSAVCDTDAKIRDRVARQYPGTLVTADVGVLLGACIYGLSRNQDAATINNVSFAAFHISVLMTGCWAALEKPPSSAPGAVEPADAPA